MYLTQDGSNSKVLRDKQYMQIDPKRKCANHGCNESVTYSGTRIDGTKRWRPHCSHCQGASYGRHPHREGVTPYKTGQCNNEDGKLGWDCMTAWEYIDRAVDTWITEIDHINGDHTDNRIENLQELCVLCHKKKGKTEGNFKGHRYRNINKESGDNDVSSE